MVCEMIGKCSHHKKRPAYRASMQAVLMKKLQKEA